MIRTLETFLPKYLFYFLSGPELQNVAKARITGSATPHLFQKDIREFFLVVPPLAEYATAEDARKAVTVGSSSHIDSTGRVLFTADAHRDNGKRFIVNADEKLTAFLELERITHDDTD